MSIDGESVNKDDASEQLFLYSESKAVMLWRQSVNRIRAFLAEAPTTEGRGTY